MPSLAVPPLLSHLAPARRVLVSGAGGGYDVHAGLPLAFALREQGKEVHLSTLSFSHLYGLDPGVWILPDVAAVLPETAAAASCFPERTLARRLRVRSLPDTVHAFASLGVQPLREAYRAPSNTSTSARSC